MGLAGRAEHCVPKQWTMQRDTINNRNRLMETLDNISFTLIRDLSKLRSNVLLGIQQLMAKFAVFNFTSPHISPLIDNVITAQKTRNRGASTKSAFSKLAAIKRIRYSRARKLHGQCVINGKVESRSVRSLHVAIRNKTQVQDGVNAVISFSLFEMS